MTSEKDKVVEAITDGKKLAEFKEDLNPDTGLSIEVLYQRAKIAFIIDPHKRGIDYFYRFMDGEVAIRAFRYRAKKERWETLRTKVWQQAESSLIRRLSNEIVRDQIEEARDCQKLRKWLFDLLTPKEVEDSEGKTEFKFKVRPNSLEGVVSAYKQVTILLQAYRQEVLSTLEPIARGAVATQEEEGPFSPEEAGEMARALLERRGGLIDVKEDDE